MKVLKKKKVHELYNKMWQFDLNFQCKTYKRYSYT